MKTLVLSNQKGGVGKSFVACQYAYHAHINLKKRVLFIDLDHQANSTKSLSNSGFPTVSMINSSQIMTEKISNLDANDFLLIPASKDLLGLEKKGKLHNSFANNLKLFLASVENSFDLCIVDTNPNPDIRMMSSLVTADYLLSPIELNQEAIDGIGSLLNDFKKIKSSLNPKLQFIGLIPNLVESTPFQKENFIQLAKHFGKLLIKLEDGSIASIKKGTAYAEAQSLSTPVWNIKKTSARKAWTNLKPVFNSINSLLEK